MSPNNKNIYKQYFTPNRVADFMMLLSIEIAPELFKMPVDFIDPACGEGAFIKAALKRGITANGMATGVDVDEKLKQAWAKDEMLTKSDARLIITDALTYEPGKKYLFTAGNPPFGIIEIKEEDLDKYSEYELFQIQNSRSKKIRSFPIEVLFLEKFLDLLQKDGLAAIVLPIGIFTNLKMRYIREWMKEKYRVEAVISLDAPVFTKEGAAAHTALLFLRNRRPTGEDAVFWASVSDVDLSGFKRDDLDEILKSYRDKNAVFDNSKLAFFTDEKELELLRWDPPYHHPRYSRIIEILAQAGRPLKTLAELMESSRVVTGYKGLQEKASTDDKIPFITSRHIASIGIDTAAGDSFIDRDGKPDTERTRLKENDVLLVRSGEGCVGRCVVVGPEDARSNVRSEVYVLRPDPGKINPYYLAVFLNCFRLPFKAGRKERVHQANFQICRIAKGVGTPNLNKQEILSLKIPVIPEDVQKKIENSYRKIRKVHKGAVRRKSRALSLGLSMEQACADRRYVNMTKSALSKFEQLVDRVEKYLARGEEF